MDKLNALNNQTAGRDKIARLVQYSSRAVWDSLNKNNCPAFIDKFKTLEYILSSFRKLLRFGRCLDVFYSTLSTIHYPDLTIRITLTMSKLSQALFLLSDHIIWLSRTGLFKNINSRKWNIIANKYWLLTLVMNLARDLYEILKLIDLHQSGRKAGLRNSLVPLSKIISSRKEFNNFCLYSYVILYGHRDVFVDTVKNICDLFIPLTTLGYTRLTPRAIGILGALSSIAGIIAIVQPHTKLLPA